MEEVSFAERDAEIPAWGLTNDDLDAMGGLDDKQARTRLVNAANIAYFTLRIADGELGESLLQYLSNQEEWPGGWLVREIFGNPFRPVSVDPVWQTWNDSLATRLAQAIYDDRTLPAGTLDNTRLAILADALEEAGCADEQILTHLRKGGEHYRGCFVLDALLGKR